MIQPGNREPEQSPGQSEPVVPTFEVGEVIMHKASGKRAVVKTIHHRCVNHPGEIFGCGMKLDRSKCDFQPSGIYAVSFDFGKENEIDVPAFLIERI